MESLNLHMVEELSRQFEVRLIAPVGSEEFAPACVQVTQVGLKPLFAFLLSAMWYAIRHARDWRPDIVLAGSGLVAPIALLAAKSVGSKAFAYAHGLDLVVPHPVYRALWRPALRKLDGLIVNSAATCKLAQSVGATKSLSIVHPGVSIPEKLDSSAGLRFRAAHGFGSAPILLSVGRLTSRKGIREFVKDVLPLIIEKCPAVQLAVIGDEPTDSLYAEGQSIRSILETARTIGVEHHVHFLGKKFGSELVDAYRGADVHVFPVRDILNDPEGFGMVAIESAAYGLQTVAYKTGGVVDAVSEGVSGILVPSGDAAAFARAAADLIEKPLAKVEVRKFAKNFSWEKFGEKLCRTL